MLNLNLIDYVTLFFEYGAQMLLHPRIQYMHIYGVLIASISGSGRTPREISAVGGVNVLLNVFGCHLYWVRMLM